MDFSENDKFGIHKSSGDHLNFHSSNALPDWQFAGADISSPFQLRNSIPVSSTCSSVPMVNSFFPNILSHPSSQNLAFIRNQTRTSTSLPVEDARIGPTSTRSSTGVGWTPPNSLQKGDVFLQTGAGNLPSNLLKFPIDSGFIERAARYSCFNGGNFRDMVNPFGVAESLSPQPKGGEIETTEVLLAHDLKFLPRALTEKNELPTNEVSKDGRSPIDHGINEGSTERNEKESGSLLRSLDEGRHGIGMSCNEPEEAESSGAGLEEPSSVEKSIGEPTNSGLATKKRRRSDQDSELDHFKGDARLTDETTKGLMEKKQKDQQNPTLATYKPNSKHGKDIPQNSDAPKEDYIHVRARRGQATNSHSLAERVRREKISERMKFLQDLVPGCSKVTGKAVMLDEIINYVQSLQRQVEFLSMKLSTVSPSLHFNIEGLLSKDIHQMCSSTSTTGLLPDIHMAHPQLHPSQHGLLTSGIPGTGNPSDLLQRIINSQMTAVDAYRDPIAQMSNVWDDELHNVLRMSFNTNIPFSTQELNGSPPPGHMKVEP